MQVDQSLAIVVVVEAGRNIIGYASPKTLDCHVTCAIQHPMILIEQFQPGGKVNIVLLPVLVSLVVENIYVAPISYLYVPHDSQLADTYKKEYDRAQMAQRAAHAGIALAGPGQKNGPPLPR